MSWQDEAMAEQAMSDALLYMGGAEWREMYEEELSDD